MNTHTHKYLSIREDLFWILLRTIQYACIAAITLALGIAGFGILDIAIEHRTARPSEIFAIANHTRLDVLAAMMRVLYFGKYSVLVFIGAFVLEQLLMIKAYLRAIHERATKSDRR